MIGLTKQERRMLLFLILAGLVGGGVLLAKRLWPQFAQELLIDGR